MRRRRSSFNLGAARYRYPTASEAAASSIESTRRFLASLSPLRVLEDRRVFHPLRDYRPAGTVSRRDQRRLVPSGFVADRQFRSDKLRFAVPNKVLICVRRKQRREVMFATKGAGKGARAPRHRNYQSDISCR